jgi:hypothetical protein
MLCIISQALQREGIKPELFAQLYFYDHAQAADLRCISNELHNNNTLIELQNR